MANDLAQPLKDICLDAVIYIKNGGFIVGKAVADKLNLPLFGIDVRYPFSRRLDWFPNFVRPVLWPLKEILYRYGYPSSNSEKSILPGKASRVLLIDDTASSGKTLRTAIKLLEDAGIKRKNIITAALRCGERAQDVVDYQMITAPIILRK